MRCSPDRTRECCCCRGGGGGGGSDNYFTTMYGRGRAPSRDSKGVWGSADSSPSGVWGEAPAAFLLLREPDGRNYIGLPFPNFRRSPPQVGYTPNPALNTWGRLLYASWPLPPSPQPLQTSLLLLEWKGCNVMSRGACFPHSQFSEDKYICWPVQLIISLV